MNPQLARVCGTGTDAQVQEKEVCDAAVLAGLIPVSKGVGVFLKELQPFSWKARCTFA